MEHQQITARFRCGEDIDNALFELRRSGAVCHAPSLPTTGVRCPTLRLAVRAEDASLARAVIRRSGGIIF